MNRKAVEWLYEQLPQLVAKGIIPAESAGALRNFYGPVDKKVSGRTVLTVFGVIGVVLVGLGIILILAHNWDQLTRLTRMLIVVGMLLAAQILAGVTVWYQPKSTAWTEGTATFLMLMIGASIALVGQTYHLVDDIGSFLLTWMLLAAPLVYLMKVNVPAVLYLIGITVWTISSEYGGAGKYAIWLLMALMLPYYRRLLQADRYANPTVVFSWFLILSVYICFGWVFENYIGRLGLLMYASLFTVTYFSGLFWFNDAVKNWRNPYKALGLAGCVILSLVLTFKDVWSSLGRRVAHAGAAEWLLAAALLILVMALGLALSRKKSNQHWLFGGVPVLTGIGFLLLSLDRSGIAATALLNAYLLVLSIYIIVRGVREERLGILNIGMLMLALLVVLRFLDINFSFIARGLVFVTLGLSFLAANLMMVRRKSGVAK